MEVAKEPTDRADRLAAFLMRYNDKPVEWGIDDCSAVFAPWLAEFGLRVKMPRYSSKDEAVALISRHGGLVPTWDYVLRDTPIMERFGPPRLGDIAVIDLRLMGPVGVICAGYGRCAWRVEEGGFHWFPARRYLKVWAVE